jgi:hypothetical protein
MAAYEIPNLRFSAESGAAVARRRFVKINEQEQGVQVGAGEAAVGVSTQPTTKAGEVLEIADGILMVEAGAAIIAGQSVEADADAKAIPLAEGTKIGIAVTNAGAAGELVSVKL